MDNREEITKKDMLSWLGDNYPIMIQKYRHTPLNERPVFLRKAVLFRISVEPDYRFDVPISILYKINMMVEENPDMLSKDFFKTVEFKKYCGTDTKISKVMEVVGAKDAVVMEDEK